MVVILTTTNRLIIVGCACAGVTRRTVTSVGTAAPSLSAQIEMESPNIKIQMKLSRK